MGDKAIPNRVAQIKDSDGRETTSELTVTTPPRERLAKLAGGVAVIRVECCNQRRR